MFDRLPADIRSRILVQPSLPTFSPGRTVVEADATIGLDRLPHDRAAYAAIQVRGHVDVPLLRGGRFVGGMTVHVSERRDWTATEVAIIKETAERTWAAVERARADDELRRLAAELRDADRQKDEFLATLAHELRSPLAPIRNALHVVQMAGGNETIDHARSMMERQLTQLVRLVDDLLDVSRVTSGKLELRRATVDLREVIGAAVETIRLAIEEAGHALTVVTPDAPIWVEGDETRLAQVLTNLLSNSAKYTDRGGQIRVSAARDGDMAVVSVADDGVGIPPAMLESVFEMLLQVDRTLEKTTGGLGIGLSLVKGLVEMHRGTIVARSEGEGRGSEFVVRLPLVQSPARNVATEEIDPLAGSSSGRRILVADDNVDSAESLAKLLEMMGNDVSTVYDGLQAVEAAESLRPDVILLDIGMPKLNGLEAARHIREQSWGDGIVLVALTGWGQRDDRERSLAAGFDHHVVKPMEINTLMKLLAGLPTI